MPEVADYEQIAERLKAALALERPAVAISFTDSLPPNIQTFNGKVPAGCRFWQEAIEGSFATIAEDHALCGIGVYTHNLQASELAQTDLLDALKVFADLGYVRPEDLPAIPVMQERSSYVLYGPLSAVASDPKLVLLFVNARQSLILSEAVQQVDHINAPAMGRPACAVVPRAINEGRAALSLGCCGARAYLDVLTDGVAVFAIPASRLLPYLERIEALAAANKILTAFHQGRRQQVSNGGTPTIKDSLAALQA